MLRFVLSYVRLCFGMRGNHHNLPRNTQELILYIAPPLFSNLVPLFSLFFKKIFVKIETIRKYNVFCWLPSRLHHIRKCGGRKGRNDVVISFYPMKMSFKRLSFSRGIAAGSPESPPCPPGFARGRPLAKDRDRCAFFPFFRKTRAD